MGSIRIKDMPIDEKPRERVLKFGVENVSSEDLIAIILKTGTKSQSVKSISSKILSQINQVKDLRSFSLSKLMEFNGIGQVKAIELIAAIELGRRVYYEKSIDFSLKMNNPAIIYEYFKYLINERQQEHFYCVYLNNQKKIIDKKLLYIGTINMSVIHPREIFKYAYLYSASSIICVHNHPAGNPEPSVEDISITNHLVKIGELQGINIIDHIIIGRDGYYSFFENNKL